MRCKQCKRDKPESEFYKPRAKGFRVTGCNACARENMSKWAATHHVGRKPEEVSEAA